MADLEGRVTDIQDAEVLAMLNLFQLAGHYTSQHGPFHDLRDALQRDQVCGPFGEPLPLPPVGNWILALGVSLLGLYSPDGQELFSRIANHQTAGDLVEAWSLQLWERGYRSLCEQLSGYFLLLHNVLTGIPPRFYTALGQEWRITWAEVKNIMRAWLGDSPAPALPALDQVPAASVEQGPPGRLSEIMRARSLSPRDGPLLGRRTDLIDGAADARVFPTILLPYTFPAFQSRIGIASAASDQPECAYMAARSALHVALLPIGCILLSLLSCLHRCTTHFLSRCFWFGTRYPGPWTSASSSAARRAHDVTQLRRCFSPFQTLCRRFLFLLCVGCLLQTGTCNRTGSGEGELTTIVGRESTPTTVHHPHDAGRLPSAAAANARIPRMLASPQTSPTKSHWSSCPQPGSFHSLQGAAMYL